MSKMNRKLLLRLERRRKRQDSAKCHDLTIECFKRVMAAILPFPDLNAKRALRAAMQLKDWKP